ncbi:uncharacterized protein L969DRAFT_612211 [Mixia osmundae IAM 14324]|uniref:uncharacterized protein n=1 Tax=Mixia osmundae (strain CBS 9802 / IAM 14324 / JCM 22182 / KY 12970) TaxID=764103 RepID=UPI0004A5555F|nr:uncharacterized protein L969DRAFT_612211 [Mixia osmundae IAM 14324]KEI36735.1 hypothetical protein L969DRAFT_612211 [Mixia osmundae IAM 14324]
MTTSHLPTGKLTMTSKLKMNDGHSIYRFGFGVYEAVGQECKQSVKWALEAGYRLIDSAEWYENEAETGSAIREFMEESSTPREEIHVTTKLMANSTYDHAQSIKLSLKKLGLDYIDTYLIHGAARLASWKACEEGVRLGLVKSIGVSNYGERHLVELEKAGSKTVPCLNQIDLHPFMTRVELVKYCQDHNIIAEAWGPLARGMKFSDPTVSEIAKAHNKTTAQVMLRWGLQRGHVVIPKSVSQARIIANAQIFDFELSNDEVEQLTALDCYLVTDWDPIKDPSV